MVSAAVGPSIYKYVNGAATRLDSATGFSNVDYYSGFAFYYDDATDTLKVFLRMSGQWFEAQSGTSAQYQGMRYLCLQSITYQRWATPFVCYAD